MLFRLFRLTKQFVADYGSDRIGNQESFYVSDDIEKVKTFIKGKFDVELDSQGKASRYYTHEEGGDYYHLEEIEAVSLF